MLISTSFFSVKTVARKINILKNGIKDRQSVMSQKFMGKWLDCVLLRKYLSHATSGKR